MLEMPVTSPSPGTGGWGIPVEGCRLQLATDRDQYQFGDLVKLRVVLENEHRDQLWVFEGAEFPYRIEVFRSSNEPAPLTLWGRIMSSRKKEASNNAVRLLRGQARVDELPMLNRVFDMSLDGKYAILVHRTLPSELDPNAWIEVTSDCVVVTIGRADAATTRQSQ